MKILIVDDKNENRILLEVLLKGNGFKVAMAENGEVALQKLRAEPFDMIISDILMPVMDGYTFCKEVKRDDRLRLIPFIFYTATYTDRRDEELAMKVGADRYIRKPVEPEIFIKMIREVIAEMEIGRIVPGKPEPKECATVLKLYDERLVKKLEKKMLDLETEIEVRKRAERTIRKLSMAVQHSPSIVMIKDMAGRIEYVNPKFEDITGYSALEVLGIEAADLGEQSGEDTEKMFRELNSGREWRGIFHNRKKNGEFYWERASISPILDKNGTITHFVKVAEDITELRESQEKYKDIFDNIMDIFYRTDNDGKITIVSPSVKNIFGYLPEEVIGETLSKFFLHSEQSDVFFSYLRKKGKIDGYESEMIKKDGSVIWLSTNAGLYRDENETILGVQGIARDVTEYKKIEKESKQLESRLQQTQKMEAVGTLAGGIAHDFNNILTAIIGFAQIAMDQLPKENPVHADLKEIYKAGQRAKNLVKQILAFARKHKEEVVPMQIVPVLKEVLKFIRSTLPATIEIRQNIEPEVGNIMADPAQIHQIIMNLCTNASHAMQDGGILDVDLTRVRVDHDFAHQYHGLRPGEFVRLSVSDTGHGIAPEILPRIFDPYFTTKGRSEGTGLGLAVSHGIIKGYGGTISIYSEPGRGSTFHVYFPRFRESVEPEANKPEPIHGRNERILFVDDEISIAKVIKRILEQLGYRVETRTSPAEALELFKARPDRFDLIITDMTMPHMTGDRLAEELMKIRPDIPVILCTGFSEKMTMEKAEGLGIKAFIMKPLTVYDLALAVRKAIEGD